MGKIAVRIVVCGKVQGVFFRQSTMKKARELGLSGYVKNLQDGAVQIEAQGSTEQIDELFKWCHIGPARAKVSSVHKEQIDLFPVSDDFVVKR